MIILNFSKIQTPWVLDIFLFNVIPIFGYPLLLTHALDKYLDLSNGKSIIGLKTFDLYWALFVIVLLVSEGLLDRERLTESATISATDQAIRILIAFLTLFLIYKFYKVSSKALRSVELKRDAGFWEYIASTFQIFAWPLCIWWIQPRINDAYENFRRKSIVTN